MNDPEGIMLLPKWWVREIIKIKKDCSKINGNYYNIRKEIWGIIV